MADNVTANAGSGGADFKTDEDTGASAHVPITKIELGANNSFDGYVSASNPMPVTGTITAVTDITNTIDATISGDALTALQLIDDYVYTDDADWTALSSKHSLIGGIYQSTPGTITDGDTGPIRLDANGAVHINDGGNSITVDGTITANLSATDNAVLDNIDTNTTGLNNCVSGNEIQADIVAALPAGTNAIGKLAANSGVDIGDVDVTSIVPGTGATNLGKAIDSAVGSTDTGIALLAKHQEDQVHLSTADGDYDILTVDSLGSLHVNAEAHHIFDELDVTTGWTVLGNDTANLATTTKHVMGTAALTFDKVNGAANTVFAGIQKTLSSIDLGSVSPHDILQGSFYIPDLTNVSYAFLRLGTDSSNYNEWRLDASVLTAGIFETGALTIGDADYNGITGNGMNSSAITYIAVGVAFNTETDTLAGIIFDQISYHTNQHTSTSINSEVSSSVSSANVNISKIANKVTNTQAGNVGTGTQRVTIATDDVNLAAIKTATEMLDDIVFTDSDAWTASTSKHALTGGVYAATPRTVTDGDTAPFAMDVNGHIITSAHASSVALADGVSNTANIMVDEADAFMGAATFGFSFNGTTWDRIKGDATNGLLVNLGSNNDVTVTGTVTVDLGANNDIQGDVAHDSADSGNPLKIGAKVETAISGVTLAADGDRTDLYAGADGVLIIRNHCNLEDIVDGNASSTDGSSTEVIAAAGAGIKQYLTSITLTNTSSTDTYCEVKSATTTKWTFPVPANGGVTHTWDPPLKPNAANEAWNFDMGAAVTTAYCSMVGFKSKV